jgi:hypothetical protein
MPLIPPPKMLPPSRFPQGLPKEIYQEPSPASPIHLSSSLVLRSGASGAVPVNAFKNPMGQDMEILEIKFEISGAATTGSTPVFGGTIWTDLMMGSYKLTNGAVPVWNFGKMENILSELLSDDQDALNFSAYTWRLPRPMFVPAGACIAPSFVHTGYIASTLNVRVGMSGRTVSRKPKAIYMPWISKYVSKAFNPLSAADKDQSQETDLFNPHPEVFHLQRFMGRTLTQNPGASTNQGENRPRSFADQYLLARIVDSYGRPIVANYTPFRLIFSEVTRSWEMDNESTLDPEGFYKVILRKDAMVLAGASANLFGQAFVSMVGWRELKAL